jgi:hypothetical protein
LTEELDQLMASSVVNQKFVESFGGENAGPSTAFGAKNAPISAQDDRFVLQ